MLATNAKPYGVYLDVVLPEQYDPLAPLRRTVKIATHDVFDPLKRDLLKTQAERQLLQVPAEGGGGVPGAASALAARGGASSRTTAAGGMTAGPRESPGRGARSGSPGRAGTGTSGSGGMGNPGGRSMGDGSSGGSQWARGSTGGGVSVRGTATRLAPAMTKQMLETTKW